MFQSWSPPICSPRGPRLLAFSSILLLASAVHVAAENGLPRAKPEKVGMSSERLERLGQVMQGYVDRGELAGTVTLIARRGKVVHYEAHGYRYAEEKIPMRTDTIFRIASMTKPIASVALMMLYEEGRFQLDDPVSKWIPEYGEAVVAVPAPPNERIAGPFKTVEAARPISIRHLLTHTAGLPNRYRGLTRDLLSEASRGDGTPAETMEQALMRTARLPLNFHPGEGWEYGGATNVVGLLVERMSAMTLDDYLRERIFEPLGMPDTHFNVPESKVDRVAAVYRPNREGKIELAAKPQFREPTRYFSGAGGLSSTVADYFRFHQMMLNGGELDGVRILGRKTVDLMITNHIGELEVWLKGPGYGFGLGYAILLDPGKASEPLSPGSFGWGGFYNTYFWVDPQEEMIGIMMSQLNPYTHLTIRNQLSVLATQAIVDTGPEGSPPVMGYRPIR